MEASNKRRSVPGATDDQVQLFMDRFVSRRKPFMVQRPDGTYSCVRRALGEQDVKAHLTGKLTIGLLPGEDGMTKFGVVDIDRASPDAVYPVWKACDSLSIPIVTAFSGQKGFHVYTFFEVPTPLAEVRTLMKFVAGHHEVWPKQSAIGPGQLGNCIKAPFGIHRVTGNWCLPVNRAFETIRDHWQVLRDVTHAGADRILADTLSKTNLKTRSATISAEAASRNRKPCLEEELRNGTDDGRRNNVGFALATEYRRMGSSEEEALAVLSEWNRLNRPPLRIREIETVCRSAFRRKEPYEYGCNPEGPLRQFVNCIGRSKCSYYQNLKKGAWDEVPPVRHHRKSE